jgi:uncharacterized phage protein (TIGR02218 family)
VRRLPEKASQRFALDGAALVYALLVLRRDGVALGLTDHDEDLGFTGQTFSASPGMTLEGLEQSADLAPDHASVRTALTEASICAQDIAAGRYADAQVELWQVDADDPGARLLLLAGVLGEIARDGEEVSLELRAACERLRTRAGRLYQRSCNARLGDEACGVDLAAPGRRARGTSAGGSASSVRVLTGDPILPKSFPGGVLRIETGPMSGLERPLRSAEAAPGGLTAHLWEALPLPLADAEEVSLTVGCDKSFASCRDLFGNAERFRGFPHIPGLSALAVQRSS